MGPMLLVQGPMTWDAMPDQLTELCGESVHRWLLNGDSYNGFTLQAQVITAGPAGSRLEVQVSDDDGANWENALNDSAPYLLVDSVGNKIATGLGLSSLAKSGLVLWRICARNGDGLAAVVLGDIRGEWA
jgi:hypothetical protein